MDAWTLSVVVGVVLVAVAVQAIAGFGFALIAMPLLILVLDVEDALVLATLLSLTNTGILAYTHRAEAPWPTVWPMLAGAAAGMPLGLALLLLAPADVIRLLVGVATVVMTGALALGARFSAKSVASELAIGGVSGALNTSTGINGPPVVLYLQGRGHAPREFRGATGTFFFGSSVIAIASYAVAGIVTREALVLFAASLPAVAVASWTGHWIAGRVPAEVFRRLVFVLLLSLAAVALVTAAVALAR